MSFQRFRVSATSSSPAPTVHTLATQPAPAAPNAGHFQGISFRVNVPADLAGGDAGAAALDDAQRYTHTFPSLAAFAAWRAGEEETRTVEFVLSDRHASRAVPPRFKEHVKLVCGRHGKNGRKKYERKFPGRKRKWESLKIEGDGCPASITYKTFEGTDEVKVVYVEEHSHPIGEANMPFTKRGRKILNARGGAPPSQEEHMQRPPGRSPYPSHNSQPAQATIPSPPPSSASPTTQNFAASSPYPDAIQPLQFVHHAMPVAAAQPPLPTSSSAEPMAVSAAYMPLPTLTPLSLPSHNTSFAPATYLSPSEVHGQPPLPASAAQDQWDRCEVLFANLRESARSYALAPTLVAALEGTLLQLYYESPLAAAAAAAAAGASLVHLQPDQAQGTGQPSNALGELPTPPASEGGSQRPTDGGSASASRTS